MNQTLNPSPPKQSLQTEIIHPRTSIPAGWDALTVPVTRASTVVFPNVAALRAVDWRNPAQWWYGIDRTPVSATLSARLAAFEGGEQALLQPSGLAAIANIYLGLLKQGDDVLIPDNVYGRSREHGDWLQNFGISARYYDPLIGADIAQLVQPNTRLIWIEAPGSVTMEVPDVPAITRVARTHGIYTAIDNTWAAGIAFKPFEHNCDISIQALTKYQSGGSDVLMGVTITRDDDLHLKLKCARMRLGFNVSADDCALVLRNLPSFALRYAAHGRSALSLAQWLKTRLEVEKVLHPALPDCGGHAHWQRDFSGSGGLFSVVFDSAFTQAQVDAFVEGLRLFKIGYSWGGACSLVVPFELASERDIWPHRGALVRFFIGLEDEQDLRADLEQSINRHLIRSDATS